MKNKSLWATLILTILVLIPFAQVRDFAFVSFDDHDYVFQNPFIQQGLTLSSIHWAFTSFHSANWHPLTWISHMLDIQFYGLYAGGHHVTSLIIHIGNTLILFFVFQRLTRTFWQSFFIAVLWGIHPLRAESVAWISERKDVLCAFFGFLTIWVYTFYTEKPSLRRYIFTLVIFMLGLMSKPMLVTLPFLLLLLDYWPLKRIGGISESIDTKHFMKNNLHLLLEKIPFFILVGISSYITYRGQSVEVVIPAQLLPLGPRIINAVCGYSSYMLHTFYPANLAVFYPYTADTAPSMPFFILSLTGLFLITLFVIRAWRIRPYLLTGWFWFLGTLVPVIGLVQVGDQSMADRYTYIPTIGLLIIIVFSVYEIFGYLARRYGKEKQEPGKERSGWNPTLHNSGSFLSMGAPLICSAAVIALLPLSHAQVATWRNTWTLFNHAIKVVGPNDLSYYCLGLELETQQRDLPGAKAYYEKTLQLNPNYFEALFYLGTIAAHEGDLPKAEDYYIKALRVSPKAGDVWNNLGNLYSLVKKHEDALKAYLNACHLQPKNAIAHYNAGCSQFALGYLEESRISWEKAVKLDPDYGDAYTCLGNLMIQQGRRDEALRYYREAVRCNPHHPGFRQNLESVLRRRQHAR